MLEQLIVAEDSELSTKLVLRCYKNQFTRYYTLYEVDTGTKENSEQRLMEYSASSIEEKHRNGDEIVTASLLASCLGRYFHNSSEITQLVYNEAIFNRELVPVDEGNENRGAEAVISLIEKWVLDNNKDNRVGLTEIGNKEQIVFKTSEDFKAILGEIGIDGIAALRLLYKNNKLIHDRPTANTRRFAKTLSGKKSDNLGIPCGSHVIIPVLNEDVIHKFKNEN